MSGDFEGLIQSYSQVTVQAFLGFEETKFPKVLSDQPKSNRTHKMHPGLRFQSEQAQ